MSQKTGKNILNQNAVVDVIDLLSPISNSI